MWYTIAIRDPTASGSTKELQKYMAIPFICGFIIVLCAIGVLAAAVGAYRKNKRIGGWILTLFVLALAFVTIPMSFHTVDTGEVAVVKHLGEAKSVRTAGTHFDLWLTESYQIYDAKVQDVDVTTSAYSSDAQTMDVQMALQYQIMSDHVIDIAQQYGSLELLENRIESIAIEKTKAVLSAHKAMDIIANRAAMSPAVEETIKKAVGEEYYVNVTTVVLTNIDFSDAFESAVEEKMIAEQKQLKAEYENKTKIAQAEAEAEAKLVAARAEAEANKLLEQSLTDTILRQMYIDKWDGRLPTVVSGENAASILLPMTDLPTDTDTAEPNPAA